MKWKTLIGKRLLVTDHITGIQRNEWTLVEISPSGKRAKFKHPVSIEQGRSEASFWTDLKEIKLLEVLP